MAAMLGQSRRRLRALAPDDLIAAISAAVEVQPELVREGRLLPTRENPLVCEEFEVTRPSRSVIRWVARWVPEPDPRPDHRGHGHHRPGGSDRPPTSGWP